MARWAVTVEQWANMQINLFLNNCNINNLFSLIHHEVARDLDCLSYCAAMFDVLYSEHDGWYRNENGMHFSADEQREGGWCLYDAWYCNRNTMHLRTWMIKACLYPQVMNTSSWSMLKNVWHQGASSYCGCWSFIPIPKLNVNLEIETTLDCT